ncbi:MAG TPA: metallophosphoesterase [Terriglobales bacterium]|nr:metallophosphoesterase [Terriglobales bacterium]
MKSGKKYSAIVLIVAAVAIACLQAETKSNIGKLPLLNNSVRFAVIGDSGTGEKEQYEIAKQMETYRQIVNFDFVIMLGDNIYGGHTPRDFARKFEVPYKPLLDAGVKFYASLGNHDDPKLEPLYKPFNMSGERYYTFKKGDVQFFALDSNYMDARQLSWLEQNLRSSKAQWKICFFHHPLYNDGKMHGPDLDLRNQLAPLLKSYRVNVVFSGHEHAYERIKPIDNIYYFIQGDSGKLVRHDFRPSEEMAKSFDRGRTFMVVEIAGENLYFETISASGETVDAGELPRTAASVKAATAAAR